MNGLDRSQFYGRMFARTTFPIDAHQEEDLRCLGKMMRDSGRSHGETPDAGFTYFGQFIDHDLTYDNTKLSQRPVEPSSIQNFRTPKLDLDLIYGGGPISSPHLYEDDGERLRIGKTVKSADGTEGGTERDIGRNDDGTPRHADADDTRNLENLIVMQIHVLFMRFHNEAVKQCNGPAFQNLGLSGNTFNRARQLVRWHYQWLVRDPFLRAIVPGLVLGDVWATNKPETTWHEEGFFIPAEFTLAAFRFGHSMVRGEYRVNCHHPRVELADLMTGGNPPPLSEDLLFEWGMLFDGLLRSSSRTVKSLPINTALVEPLHDLPEYTKRQHSEQSDEPQPRQLSARTLLRGARAGLPSGQEVAQQLVSQGLLDPSQVLTAEQLTAPVPGTTSDASGSMLRGTWMLEHTPLYYYLLKEAEVLGTDHTLGPVGGRIVAEVIERVLWEDDESYIKVHGSSWTPPPIWEFRDGGGPEAITSFEALVQMIGDDLPKGCSATIPAKVNAFKARLGRRVWALGRKLGFQ